MPQGIALTLYPAPDPGAIPLHLVSPESCPGWLERQDEATRAQLYKGWKKAVERARHWVEPEG